MFVNLQETSFIPEQIEKIWADDSNKENIQEISRRFFKTNRQIMT